MPSVVSIQVTMDEKGVVTGVKNINSNLDQMGSGIQKAGSRGNVVFTELTNQQHKAREAALLLTEATGVQIPRALDKVFAKVPGLQGALAGLFNVAAVALFFNAIVQGVNHFDELKAKIRDAGFELSIFGEHIRSIFGGGDQAILLGQLVSREQTFVQPLVDSARKAGEAAALASKTGFGAIQEQGKQAVDQINQTANTQIAAAQKAFADEKELAETTTLVHNAAQTAIRAARKETAAQFAALSRDQMNAAKKDADQLTLINLEGSGKILQQEQIKKDEIDRLRAQGAVSEKVAQEQRVNAHFEANQQIYKLYDDYRRATDKINDDTAINLAKGFDKITVEMERRKDEAQHEFDRTFGSLGENDSRRTGAEKALQDRLTDIDRVAEQQRLDLIKQNTEATIQLQEKAAIAALPAWARASAQIQVDYKDAMRAIDKDLADHTINEEDAQKKRGALWKDMNAKLVDEHKRVVDQMAGQLESFFSGDISQNIMNMLKKFLFKMLAEWLSHFAALQNGFGGIFQKLFGGGAGGSSGGGFSLGSLFGLGGSSSGGSSAGAGSGVNQSFINSLGVGGSSSGSSFSLAGLGGLGAAGAMFGVGAIFSNAISDILSPTAADRPKADIGKDVMAGGQASVGQIFQDYKDGKIPYGIAVVQMSNAEFYEESALRNILGDAASANSAANSLKAMLDEMKRDEKIKASPFNLGLQFGAAQFHDGGFTGNAGFRLRSNEIKAVLRNDEFVMNPAATKLHRGTLERMNRGESPMGGTIIIQALDAKSVEHAMRNGLAKHIFDGLRSYTSEGGGR